MPVFCKILFFFFFHDIQSPPVFESSHARVNLFVTKHILCMDAHTVLLADPTVALTYRSQIHFAVCNAHFGDDCAFAMQSLTGVHGDGSVKIKCRVDPWN